MIVVKVELHSARTGEVTELGRTFICNVGGTRERGDYDVTVARKGITSYRDAKYNGKATRTGEVKDYPRLSYNIWRLVSRALLSAFPEEKKNV